MSLKHNTYHKNRKTMKIPVKFGVKTTLKRKTEHVNVRRYKLQNTTHNTENNQTSVSLESLG